MKQEDEDSEFISKVNELSKEAQELIDGNKNRMIIILASEDQGEETAQLEIINGRKDLLVKGLSSFFSTERGKELLKPALMINIFSTLNNMVNNENKSSEYS